MDFVLLAGFDVALAATLVTRLEPGLLRLVHRRTGGVHRAPVGMAIQTAHTFMDGARDGFRKCSALLGLRVTITAA